jgi:hypothetical protein
VTPVDPVPALALHLGSLHAYETALVLLVAFGPFLVIVGLVVRDRRRAVGPGEGLEQSDGGSATEARPSGTP